MHPLLSTFSNLKDTSCIRKLTPCQLKTCLLTQEPSEGMCSKRRRCTDISWKHVLRLHSAFVTVPHYILVSELDTWIRCTCMCIRNSLDGHFRGVAVNSWMFPGPLFNCKSPTTILYFGQMNKICMLINTHSCMLIKSHSWSNPLSAILCWFTVTGYFNANKPDNILQQEQSSSYHRAWLCCLHSVPHSIMFLLELHKFPQCDQHLRLEA